MIKFYLSLFIIVLSFTGVANATCGGEILLPKGKSSTVVTGAVSQHQICEYTFYGKRGQVLQVSFAKYDRPQAFLFLPIEKPLTSGEPYTLPRSGKYTLRVALTVQDRVVFSTPQHFTLQFSLATKEKNHQSFTGGFGAIIPCDYCTGIETRLNIYENGTYFLREKYLGLGANSTFLQQGKWFIHGQAIGLHPDDPKKDDRFLVYKNGSMYWIAPFEANSSNPSLRFDYRLTRQ